MMRRAFTLLEVMMVVVILGILAALVVPRFGGVTDEAKASALEAALGGVRSSIASFRTRAVIEGTGPFPTLAELTTRGTVVQGDFPINPYNGESSVQSVSPTAAAARTVSGSGGWNYYVDNAGDPPAAVFYANSADTTTIGDGAGGYRDANDL